MDGSPKETAISAAGSTNSYTGPLIFGWLFIATAAVLLLTSFASLIGPIDVTLPATPATTSKSMGFAAAAFQGMMFLATGLAIVQRRMIAIRLVWAVTILAGIGVVFRGLIPLDIVLWLLTLGLAKWFSTKSSLLTR